MTQSSHFIQDQETLNHWCQQQLHSISILALDTEFMRVKTYFPKLCLIQLATNNNEMVCVDPLTISDLSPLAQLFEAPHILKIIHSASQDLETIVHSLHILPQPVYDTQIAIHTLGEHSHLMSYQDMVQSYQDVLLEKDQARTQWDKRPLSSKQIEYAYNDVRYLIDCYKKIHAKIQEKELEQKLTNAFHILQDISNYEPNTEGAWKKVKGQRRLNAKERQLLKRLAAVREELAIKRNLPKRWIIKDDALINMSRKFISANKQDELEHDSLLRGFVSDIKIALITAIQAFLE